MGAKKSFRTAACLSAASGWTGGQPQRRQVVAGFARNWPGVPRSQDAEGLVIRSRRRSRQPIPLFISGSSAESVGSWVLPTSGIVAAA